MPGPVMQRFKGAVKIPVLWLGQVMTYGLGSVYDMTTAGTQTIPNASANATISSSSAISVWTMEAIPRKGAERVISAILVSSGIFIKASAGTSFDASTNTVIKSTYAMQITLLGISTARWAIKSVWPPPSTLVGGSGITLSTTT